MTYYLVIVPALLLSVFGLIMGFSAQTVTAISAGEPYTAYARPLIIILVSLVIATNSPRASAVAVLAHLCSWALGFNPWFSSPLRRSEGGNTNWVKVGPIMVQPSEFLKHAHRVPGFYGLEVGVEARRLEGDESGVFDPDGALARSC